MHVSAYTTWLVLGNDMEFSFLCIDNGKYNQCYARYRYSHAWVLYDSVIGIRVRVSTDLQA